MSAPSSNLAGAPAVADLARHIVAVERLCAREVALGVVAGTDCVPRPNDEARKFYWLAAHMVSAKLEVDKWEPLVTALQRHAVDGSDAVLETERVWNPVYQAMQAYKDARFRALRGGRLTRHAGVRDAAAQPDSTSASGSITGSAESESSPAGSATSFPRQAGGVGHVPTTLVLPRMTFEDGEPVFTGLMQSFGASSLGVCRTSVAQPACAAPADVDSGPIATHSESGGTAANASEPDDENGGEPVYDRSLLVHTAGTLRQARTDLDAIAFQRISAWATPALGPEALRAADASLRTVESAAAASRTLDHCAVEIQKQLVVVDEPHEDIFTALGISGNDPLATTLAAADDDNQDATARQ